jgi:predicted membrane GTPase involved in stress response
MILLSLEEGKFVTSRHIRERLTKIREKLSHENG